MTGARVLGGRRGLRVEGHGEIFPGSYDSELVAALEVIGPASLASLRQALRRWSPRRSLFAYVGIIDQPANKVSTDPDRYFREPVELRLFELEGQESDYNIFAESYGDPEDGLPSTARIERLIEPLLRRHHASATVSVDDDESDFGGAYQLGVSITMPTIGRTVRDAYELGVSVNALIKAAAGGAVQRETALDLLRSGHADALLGLEENEWIDFKRQGYAKTDRGKLELSKDVAAFANAGGGVLVLGMATTPHGDTDRASAITPCAPNSVSRQSYRALIGRRVHPPLEQIEILRIPQQPSGDVWVISVPPQPHELKPFLVHGALVGGKVNDAYYSIVVRRDDGAVPTTPQAVHALLSAGRAALRVDASGCSG